MTGWYPGYLFLHFSNMVSVNGVLWEGFCDATGRIFTSVATTEDQRKRVLLRGQVPVQRSPNAKALAQGIFST